MSMDPRLRPRPRDERIGDAYRRMASEARYRPAAPSDGFGNIVVPRAELDLDAEVRDYVRWFREEEAAQSFRIGCSDYQGAPALVYLVEAARLSCGVAFKPAATLARMATEELEALVRAGKGLP